MITKLWLQCSSIVKQNMLFWQHVPKNIWLLTAWYDLEMDYVHIRGKENVVADLLYRWRSTKENILKLHSHIADRLWLQVPN